MSRRFRRPSEKRIFTHELYISLTDEEWERMDYLRWRFADDVERRFNAFPTNNELIRRMIRYFRGPRE